MDMLDVMSDSDCSESSGESNGNTSSSESSVSNQSDSSIVAFETARVLKQSVDLPKGLCEDASIFEEFFSLDTWNQLAPPIQMHLQQFLPSFSDDPRENDHERQQTVLALFNNTVDRFGSTPLADFQRNLEEGNFRPEIARVQASIQRSKRREHRFQECERISRMAKSMLLSRNKLLKLAYSSPDGSSLRVNPSCSLNDDQLASTSNLKSSEATQRSKKRYFNEIASIAAATGLHDSCPLTDDEDYPGEPPCRMTRMQRRHFNSMQGGAMSPGSESRVQSTTAPRGGCLDHLVDSGGFFHFSEDMYRQRIHQHKRRKLDDPDNAELNINGVELVDILTAAQLSATVRKALAQSTKHSEKKTKIKTEPTFTAMNSTPPDPHLHPPLHINVHSVNAQMMTTNQIHSPTSLLTINKVETFPEVSSPPRTPPPPMPTALPTTVFQHLSPNLPSFHKQLPPPTTSIQQELFADQSVNFQTDSESEDEMPIKSEPPSPIRIVETSPDNPTIQAITDTPSIPVFTTQCADNGFLDATMPPSVNPPLITVQVIKKSLTPPPQPIKHEAEVNIVPRIFEIKSEMPTINAHYTQPPVTIHMPQYGGTVKAATLSDLEGIDMMHLPVDLDDSGNIDLLNEIDVEAIEVTEIKPSVLLKDSHSSFFALIRDIFCATVNHRTTVDHLNSIISGWLANPITALNDWYVEAENWLTLIPSAIQFLAGEVLEQPEDYVPYVEYKPQLLIYQWIGAGRDSDQHLNPLCDFWLQRRNELGSSNSLGQSVITQSTETGHRIAKTNSSGSTEGEEGTHNTERLSSPLPPRCPTGWTVVKANDMEIDEFRKQERRRFENPHLSFTYRLHGYESVVGPVKGIYTQIPVHSKARGHNMLTLDRPTFVTILTLVRDATARLPNGEGTRSEICQLLRSSQYISPDASDSVLQTIVSGALDRMHTEHDPCVRYDPKRKIWIYLHRNRNEEEFEKMHQQFQGVSKHKKQSSRKMKSKSLIKSPISAAISGPSNSVSPVSSKGAVLFSSAPSIAMLPPLSIVSSPTISSPLPSSPLITTPIVTVQSPQPQSKPQPQQSKHQTLQPKPQTPQPNDPVTQNPLQATVLPPATIPSPITPIISPVSVQPKPQQIPPPQQLINKLHTPKKSVVKVEINSIKPITNMQKIEKTDQTSVNDFAGSDGQAIPIIIGQAKLVPATNQPILPQQIMAQRVISANIENKTITAKKSNKAQPQPSIHVVQPHGVAHSVQPHAIQQAQRMQQVSSPTIKIAQQPIQTQLPQIQQVSSPTIKIAQQPPHSQLTQTSINTPITSIKPTYNTVTASNLSFSNITPKSSIIKTTMIQPPSTSITMSAQPQQSILIQNHNNRVPTQMFVPSNAITTTKKVNKPPLLVQQQQQQPQQTINQNFVIPINISTQSIVQTQKATTSLANQQQVVQPVKPVLRTTAVPIQSSATHKPGMSLLQQNQPAKSVARASITSGKSLLSPSVAAANMTFQQQKQLQKTQTLLPSNIVPIQGKVSLPTSTAQSVIIPKIVSTATTAKGQPTTLTPAQQRLILQNIIAQQKQQKQQRANAGNSINLVTSTPLVSTANTQHQPMHMKNVIVSQQNSSNFMQRIIASSAATSMVISTTPASQQSTITSHASSGLTPKPTSTANSLINRQIIQIQQNNAQPTNQPKPPLTNATLAKVQTVSTSNLTPQQQQNLLQSIKQQQMRVQNQQANATPQQQTLMVKQQQVLQQIQKQLQHQQNNAISPGTSLLSQSPGTIISTPTSSNQSTLTSSSSSSNISAPTQSVTRIIRPGIIRHQPFIQTVSSTPVTSTTSTLPTNMTKVLSNTTGQIISLESLLQKQGQSIGSGTTLRVAGTKPGQANIIQLASGSGSAMAQYAIVSQGPQGRSMISLTSTPQRLVNTQSVATTTTSSLQSFAGTTLLKTVAESPPRTTNSAPSIVQQPKLVQPSSLTKVIGIQSVTSSGGSRNRPNATTAIRMMNTSNLNIAQIAGKPVIISSKPNGPQAQTNTSTSRQNVVWQNPTPLNNAPPKLTNSSFVLADQAGKVQSNVVQQHFDQSTTSTSRVSVNSQAVMFGNQVVKIQPNTLAVNQSQQSTPAPHPKPTTQSTGNTSLLTQSGTTRTVVLGQTGQTIRVHSPAQSGVATSNNSMQGLPSMSTQHMAGGQGTKNTIKGSQLTTVAGQQRVVLAVQGGGQILLPSGFQGGAINIKSLQGLKMIPMMQQNMSKDAAGNIQRQGFTQIIASPKVSQPPNPGSADS